MAKNQQANALHSKKNGFNTGSKALQREKYNRQPEEEKEQETHTSHTQSISKIKRTKLCIEH